MATFTVKPNSALNVDPDADSWVVEMNGWRTVGMRNTKKAAKKLARNNANHGDTLRVLRQDGSLQDESSIR